MLSHNRKTADLFRILFVINVHMYDICGHICHGAHGDVHQKKTLWSWLLMWVPGSHSDCQVCSLGRHIPFTHSAISLVHPGFLTLEERTSPVLLITERTRAEREDSVSWRRLPGEPALSVQGPCWNLACTAVSSPYPVLPGAAKI